MRIVHGTAIRLLATALVIALSSGGSASAAEPAGWDKPLHAVVVPLPPEWTSEYDAGKDGEAQSLDVTCRTVECAATQEVCTIVVTNDPIPEPGFIPAAWFVSMTIGAAKIRANLLKGAKPGTKVTREPETMWLGDRSWYVAENLAPYGWKSLSHATSVIDGRFVRVRCRTCDRGDDRFGFAHKLLASIKVAP